MSVKRTVLQFLSDCIKKVGFSKMGVGKGESMALIVTIRERAQKRGIQNANQLGVALGVAPNVSARLWAGEFDKLGMNTFEKLCEILFCQPNALFRYEPHIRKAVKKR